MSKTFQYKKNSGQVKLTANVVNSDFVFGGFYKKTDSGRILLSNSSPYTFTPQEKMSIDCDVNFSTCGQHKNQFIQRVNETINNTLNRKDIPYIVFYKAFDDNNYYLSLKPSFYNSIISNNVELFNNSIVTIKGWNEYLSTYMPIETHKPLYETEVGAWNIYKHIYGTVEDLIDDSMGKNRDELMYNNSIVNLNIVPNFDSKLSRFECYKNYSKQDKITTFPTWTLNVSERNPIVKLKYNEENKLEIYLPILSSPYMYETRWDEIMTNGLPLFRKDVNLGNHSLFKTNNIVTFYVLDQTFATLNYGFNMTYTHPDTRETISRSFTFSKENESQNDYPIPKPQYINSIQLFIEHEYFKYLNNGTDFTIPIHFTETLTLPNGKNPKYGYMYKDSTDDSYAVYVGVDYEIACTQKYDNIRESVINKQQCAILDTEHRIYLKYDFLTQAFEHLNGNNFRIKCSNGRFIFDGDPMHYMEGIDIKRDEVIPKKININNKQQEVSNISLEFSSLEEITEDISSLSIIPLDGDQCENINNIYTDIMFRLPNSKEPEFIDKTIVRFNYNEEESKSYITINLQGKPLIRNTPNLSEYTEDKSQRNLVPYELFKFNYEDNTSLPFIDGTKDYYKIPQKEKIEKLSKNFKYIGVVSMEKLTDNSKNIPNLLMGLEYNMHLGEHHIITPKQFNDVRAICNDSMCITDSTTNSQYTYTEVTQYTPLVREDFIINIDDLDLLEKSFAVTFFTNTEENPIGAKIESIQTIDETQGHRVVFRLYGRNPNSSGTYYYVDYPVILTADPHSINNPNDGSNTATGYDYEVTSIL